MSNELEKIERQLEQTEDDEITISLLYQKIDILEDKANKYDSLVEKMKNKINKELPLVIVGGRRNSKTLNYGIKLGRKQVLQELLEER